MDIDKQKALLIQYWTLKGEYDKLKNIAPNLAKLVAADMQTVAQRLGWDDLPVTINCLIGEER